MAVAAVWLVEPARAEGFAAAPERDANLTIHIERISPQGGVLRLGVYDAAHYPDDKSVTPLAAADPCQPMTGAITVTLNEPAARPLCH